MIARPVGVSPTNLVRSRFHAQCSRQTSAARMKERDFPQRDRVNSCGLDLLEIVAALTGARQIIFRAAAAQDFGNDVFVGKRIGRKGFLAEAVFAAEMRAFTDQSLQPPRDFAFRHSAAGLIPN